MGDRYELIMGNVSLRGTVSLDTVSIMMSEMIGPGFYRCVNKYDNLNLVSSLYYIEPRMTDQNEEVMVRLTFSSHVNKSYFRCPQTNREFSILPWKRCFKIDTSRYNLIAESLREHIFKCIFKHYVLRSTFDRKNEGWNIFNINRI